MKNFSFSFLFALSIYGFQNNFGKEKTMSIGILEAPIKVSLTQKKEGSMTIRSAHAASLSFYLFDLEGKLVYQTNLKQAEEQVVTGLTKGTYLYNAFDNDKIIDGGKIIIR